MEEDAPLEVCASPGIYRCEGCDGREDEIIGTEIGPGDGICVQKQCADIENWKRAARDTPVGYVGSRRVTGATIPGLVERQSEAQIEAFRAVAPPPEAVAGCAAGAVPIEEEDSEQQAREEAEAREVLRRQQVERGRASADQARAAEEEALLQAVADGTAWQLVNTGMMYSSIESLSLAMYIEVRDHPAITELTIETPEVRTNGFPTSERITMSYMDAAQLHAQHWVNEGHPSERLSSGWMFKVFERQYFLVRWPHPTHVSSNMSLMRIAQYGQPVERQVVKKTKRAQAKVYGGIGYPNRRRYTLEQMLLPYTGNTAATRELAQQLVDEGVIAATDVDEDDPRVLLENAVAWMEDNPDAEILIRISPKFKNQSGMIITGPYRTGTKKSKTKSLKSKSRRRKTKSKSRRRKSKSKSRRRKSKSKSRRRKSKSKSGRRKPKSKSRRRKTKSRRRKSASKSRRRKSKSKSRRKTTKSSRRKSKSKSRKRKSKSKSRRRKSKSKSRRRKSKSKSRRRKSKSKMNLEFEVYNASEDSRVAVYKTRRGAEIRANRENSRNSGNFFIREVPVGHAKHTKTKAKSKSRKRKSKK